MPRMCHHHNLRTEHAQQLLGAYGGVHAAAIRTRMRNEAGAHEGPQSDPAPPFVDAVV